MAAAASQYRDAAAAASEPRGALEIPILLEQALRRALSRDPARRFPSMQALIAALMVGLRPDSDSQRSRRRKRWAQLAGFGGISP